MGIAIKGERSIRGFSQEELAERAGLHRTYISDVERGARNPSIESIEKLARALELSISALFERAGNRSAAKRGEDILLVEDSIDDIELTTRAFAKAGITNSLHCVRDGEEALDYIFAAGPYMHRCYAPLPQVILLDLNLPKKSGVEVLKRLKTDRLTREIPVIVLTGSRRDRDIRECRRLGAANYLVKPVDFENFSRITRYLSLGWKLVNAEPSHMRT